MTISKLKGIALSATLVAASTVGAYAADLRIAYTGFSTDNTFWIGVAKAAAAQADEMGVELIDMTASSPDAAAQKML